MTELQQKVISNYRSMLMHYTRKKKHIDKRCLKDGFEDTYSFMLDFIKYRDALYKTDRKVY